MLNLSNFWFDTVFHYYTSEWSQRIQYANQTELDYNIIMQTAYTTQTIQLIVIAVSLTKLSETRPGITILIGLLLLLSFNLKFVRLCYLLFKLL